MIQKGLIAILTLTMTLFVTSCKKSDDGSGTTPPNNSDIPADPGTTPPATAPDTGAYVPSSLSVTPPPADNPARVRLTVGGLTASGVTFTTGNLTIVEDGVVKGFKLTTGASAGLRADIAFIIDNTGSMSSGIQSVKNSVLAFVNALRASGQDVQVGIVAYNDDYLNDGDSVYTVSASDSASLAAVYGYRPLTSNLDSTGTLYQFITNLPATSGGDSPELCFSGLDFARRNFAWRAGAQHIYIVITDITSWGKNCPAGMGKGIGPTYPWTDSTLGVQLRSEGSVVHCISPENEDSLYLGVGEYNVKPLSTITGGSWVLFNYSVFDLTTLPILGVTTSSALVEFLKGGDPSATATRTIRVVVQVSSTERGERSMTTSY